MNDNRGNNRTLLGVLIDEMDDEAQERLIDELLHTHRFERAQELIDQAEALYRLKRGMIERMDAYRASESWEGAVDRQGGSFTQDELNDTGWH